MERLCDKSSSHYRRNIRDQHPYLHQKELYYVWVQLFRQRLLCLYEYMKSFGRRKVEMQARTVKWGGQKCCRDHKIWLVGEKTIVVHVPQNSSKSCSMFLKVPNTSIKVQVIGKRLNRGWIYGLIPVIYRFCGQEQLVNWLIKKIYAVKKKLECKVSKCLK